MRMETSARYRRNNLHSEKMSITTLLKHIRTRDAHINALKNSINIGDSIIINDSSWAFEKGKKPQLFKQVSFTDDNALENIIRGEVGVVLSEPRCEYLYVDFSWENKLLEEEMIDVYIPRLGITVCVLFTMVNACTL